MGALSKLDLTGMRVLNLFSYSGAFSVIALQGGAAEVVSVEQSRQTQASQKFKFEWFG